MDRQEFYRQEYSRRKPGWRHSLYLFRDVIGHYVSPASRVLDVGCGHADFLQPIYCQIATTVGLDPDTASLGKNVTVGHRVSGLTEHMPFACCSFDIVACSWLCEHLWNPDAAFREVRRVLRPGGHVIFLTPNAWNYNTWIIRLTPHWLHDILARIVLGRQEHDTYRVAYRFNTARTIERTLDNVGFRRSELILHDDPTYISLNRPLFELACAVERLLDLPAMRFARVHLIGVYEKL